MRRLWPALAIILYSATGSASFADRTADAALLDAAKKKDAGAVKAALAQGANANARDDTGETPLVIAARQGQAEIVQALLARKAEPRARTWYGKVAILEAARAGVFRWSDCSPRISATLRSPRKTG